MDQHHQTPEEFIKQINDLKQELSLLKQLFDKELNERKLVEFNLRERVKELNCHNQISGLMADSSLSLDYIIAQIVQIIPPSWQFPEIAQAMVEVKGKIYQTPYFKKSVYTLSHEIKVNGEIVGSVQVCYPEDRIPPTKPIFLKEEENLLFSIAVKIGNFIEHNKKEEAILEREEKYKKLVESINEIVYEITSDGVIKYISPSVTSILGFNASELVGQNILNYVFEDDKTRLANRLSYPDINTAGLHEYRFLTQTGQIKWLSKSTATIDKKGLLFTRAGVMRDITDLKNSEEAIFRANRLYAVISQVNQAIVHTKNRYKLLEEICNIALEFGKFRMAWIGVIDEKTQKIIPIASKGDEDDYLSLIKPITLTESPQGFGPTGLALRNGHYFVCNDIGNDPVMQPWKEEALKRGFRSSISLPIKQFGKIQASYNLYASTPNFFNSEEINLLEEIAGDIGFAFEALASEEERKIAEEESRKFKTINEEANFGSALTTMDGYILYINPAFAEMHQYHVNELIGEHISIFHNPEQMIRVEEKLNILMGKGEFSAEEIWHTRKDGSIFPTLMNASVIFDSNQVPQYFSATAINITDLVQKEEELRQSEEDLNNAQEIAQMGSWLFDVKTGTIKWSKNYFKLFTDDSTKASPSFEDIIQYIYPDDREYFEQKRKELLHLRSKETMYFRMVLPNGKLKWIQSNVVPQFENNKLIRINGISIDITEKKLAEEEINRQNLRLNAIINAMPDLMFILDSAGTYLEFYSRHTEKLIAPVNEFIGKNLHDFFDPDSAKSHIRKINECLDSDNLISYEYTIDNPNTPEVFEARLIPLEDNKVLAFVRDITDKKQKEILIRKLSQAVEQSPVLVVITDLNGNIEYVNQAFSYTTGYSFEEAFGKNPRILKSGTTDPAVYEDLWETIISGKQWEGEWINKKKNGELYWESVSIAPIQNELGEMTNYIAVKQDITQRKQAEDEILELNSSLEKKIEERTAQLAEINLSLKKEIEERKTISEALQLKTEELESFFNVALDLLCIADIQGNFIRVNKAWENILGYSVPDLEQRQFLEFVHPDDIEATLKSMTELSEQHPILNFVNRYKTKDGSYRFIEWRSSPSGKLIYAAARDITERIRWEEETQKARLDAEQANMAKSEFLSRMSHELRTPMNAILGFAQLLDMSELNPSQKRGVDHILHGGKHLLGLINEVLDISRIESGKMSLSTEPVKIKEILGEMIDIIQPLSNEKKVSVEVIMSDDTQYSVFADRQRLKQVLINLLSNAIKYNKQNGKVILQTSKKSGSDNLEKIRINISDTGLGIRKEDMSKLFSPFERIGAEFSTTEGSGLGLTVVKKLMEAMNGEVGVESIYGEGSTFWIELPVTESQLEKAIKSGTLDSINSNKADKAGSILYIEDNFSNVELIEQILTTQRPDIKLIVEMYGSKAIQQATEYQPNLILLDLNLPDIHGSKVLELILSNEKTKNIPVVVISADAMSDQFKRMIDIGAKKYLTKPIDITLFLATVDKYMK